MVCIYCNGSTSVTNSRHQKRLNQQWRRRQCDSCNSVVTTLESVDTAGALQVSANNAYRPFVRDKLFLSLYDSLRHRKTAQNDATALTATVLVMVSRSKTAVIEKTQLIDTAIQVLRRFDPVAAVHYQAFHPTRETASQLP